MDERLKNAFTKVINKHHSAVQTDEALGRLDYDDNKWFAIEKKSKQFWADYETASAEFKSLLERCVIQ